jgi:hypothetical protein
MSESNPRSDSALTEELQVLIVRMRLAGMGPNTINGWKMLLKRKDITPAEKLARATRCVNYLEGPNLPSGYRAWMT